MTDIIKKTKRGLISLWVCGFSCSWPAGAHANGEIWAPTGNIVGGLTPHKAYHFHQEIVPNNLLDPARGLILPPTERPVRLAVISGEGEISHVVIRRSKSDLGAFDLWFYFEPLKIDKSNPVTIAVFDQKNNVATTITETLER